jgi:pimeloyl-ACP methyl ester carboxylesterase
MAIHGLLRLSGTKLYYKVRGQGPALLVLQGGSGNADASDGIASYLDPFVTTISYDRRGLLRSPLEDASQCLTIEQHAEDASALIRELGVGPVFVFGTSLGALIGLELAARSPDQVLKLVAHEPLLTKLLSSEWQERYAAIRAEIRDTALCKGPREAIRKHLCSLGIDRDDREDDAEPPVSTREQSRQTDFLLTREARAMDRFELKLDALCAMPGKVIPAYGASSRYFYPAQCAMALGRALGCAPLEFPGGHTGYVLRPRACAETLIDTLGLGTRESQIRFAAQRDDEHPQQHNRYC